MEINNAIAKTSPRLVYSPHPICAAADRKIYYTPFLKGESIAHYFSRLNIRIHQPVVMHLNDKPVPADEWNSTCPAAGDLITVRAAVQGGGGGGSDPVRTMLTLAVLAASQGTMGAWANLMVGGSYGSSLVAVGGMLLVNALIPPPETPDFSDNTSPTYSLTNGGNRARQFQPLPIVMGTHKITPDLGAKPYTDFVGEDQYLYQCFNFGLSDITLSSYKIGDTPLADYEINVANDLEESGVDGSLVLFPSNVDSIAGGELNKDGSWVQRTSSIDTVQLAFDISGLLYYTVKGGVRRTKANVQFEYRAVGSGTWLALPGVYTELINGDRNPFRATVTLDVPTGQYDVRARYVNAFYSVHRYDIDLKKWVDYWYAISDNPDSIMLTWSLLKSFQSDASDYTGQKRVALRIKATGQLQGAVDQFNAIASARCPVWNGSTWSTAATSNPAWWYLWFARGAFDAAGVRLYGAGLPDARIDIEAIKDWGIWCAAKGLTFNGLLDRKMSCQQVLQLIARCGRATPTWATGKLGAIWDAANQPAVAHFGMANIRRNSFRVDYLTGRLADEVVIEFVNPANNWQPDTVRAKVPGVTNPQNPVSYPLFGCTSEAMAGKEANLVAAEQSERRRQISFETDMEGLVVQRGDVATLSHDLTQWDYSGRVVFGTATVLMLNKPVPFTPATQHYVGLRSPDGSYAIYDVVYQAGESDTITLGTPLPLAPDSDPDNPAMDYLWFFAPVATPGKRVKITDVKPLSAYHVRITATDETDAYYLAENTAYTYVPPSTYGINLPIISNLEAGDTLIQKGSNYGVRIGVVWDVTGEYGGAIIRVAAEGQPLREMGKTLARRFEFEWEDEGNVDIEVTLINLQGKYGTSSRASINYAVLGKDKEPSDIVVFSATLQDYSILLKWDAVSDIDVNEYEIRQGTDWATSVFIARVKATEYKHAMVVAGTHDFLVKAIDTSANEAINAATTQIVIASPGNPAVNSRYDNGSLVMSWTAPAGSFPIVEYEIRTGTDWVTGTFVAAIKGTSYALQVDFSGTKRYWVAATDAVNNTGSASNIDAVITPPAQPVLTAEVIDNNVLLRWGHVTGTLPVQHYEVRKGEVFASAEVLQTIKGTFAAFFETLAGSYVYWVVGVDSAGNYGTEVSVATNVNEPPDYQLNVEWYSDFSGTKTSALVMSNGDLLVPVDTVTSYQNHFINNGYNSPQDQIDAGFAHFIQPSVNSAVYEEIFDYGTVLPATLVKAALSKTVITGAVTITPTLSTRKLITDPWDDNVGVWLVYATDFRYVKLRLDYAATGGDDLLQNHSLSVRLDTKLKNDAGSGTANAGDAGGTLVTFNKAFIDIESINVSANTTSNITAVYDFTDAPNPTSFKVLLFDQVGTRVSGGFSWGAKGY